MAGILGYQDPILTFFHGYFCGLFVEGGCRWGYDPLWPKKTPDSDQSPDDPDQAEEDEHITDPGVRRDHTTAQRRRWL